MCWLTRDSTSPPTENQREVTVLALLRFVRAVRAPEAHLQASFLFMSQYCKVWSKFSSKTTDGEILHFRIVDVPDGRLKDVADVVQKYLVTEDVLFRASGVTESIKAMNEAEELLESLLGMKPHHVVVCCVDDGTENVNEIIGASRVVVTKKDDLSEDLQPRTKEMKKFIEIMLNLYSKFDAIKIYGLDTIHNGRGVVVHPKYRRLGIAREFFKVRRLMCKEHGIPMTGAWMSATGSQRAAEQDGWETRYEETYKDLGDQHGVTFKNTPPSCKYMIGRPE